MKLIAVIILLIGFSYLVSGQKTASEYFGSLPDIPGTPCSISDTARAHYSAQLLLVSNELNEDIAQLLDEEESFVREHQANAEATAMKNAGFAGVDVQEMKKMDKKHMSEKEKQEMADQMMQKYMNISMDEVNNLKKLDTAGQRRWSQAYMSEKMADQEADPKKLQEANLRNKQNFDLQQRLKDLIDIKKAREDKYYQQFDTLQKVADTARADLDRLLKPLYAKLDSGDLQDGEREAIEDEIYQHNMSYCFAHNPPYCAVIDEIRQDLLEALIKAEYDTLENVQHRVLFSQLGVGNPNYKPRLYALQAVQSYARLLESVFKYSVGTRSKMTDVGAE
ncbi:MAG: hypothetical protein HXX13_15370 [Bacteroidetes bacterium]|nr:hypothetical protein [Bacteroidota bacterium]